MYDRISFSYCWVRRTRRCNCTDLTFERATFDTCDSELGFSDFRPTLSRIWRLSRSKSTLEELSPTTSSKFRFRLSVPFFWCYWLLAALWASMSATAASYRSVGGWSWFLNLNADSRFFIDDYLLLWRLICSAMLYSGSPLPTPLLKWAMLLLKSRVGSSISPIVTNSPRSFCTTLLACRLLFWSLLPAIFFSSLCLRSFEARRDVNWLRLSPSPIPS